MAESSASGKANEAQVGDNEDTLDRVRRQDAKHQAELSAIAAKREVVDKQLGNLDRSYETLKIELAEARVLRANLIEGSSRDVAEYTALCEELLHGADVNNHLRTKMLQLAMKVNKRNRTKTSFSNTTSIDEILHQIDAKPLLDVLRKFDEGEQDHFISSTDDEREERLKSSHLRLFTLQNSVMRAGGKKKLRQWLPQPFIATSALTFEQVKLDAIRYWNLQTADPFTGRPFCYAIGDEGGSLRMKGSRIVDDMEMGPDINHYMLFEFKRTDMSSIMNYNPRFEIDAFTENEQERLHRIRWRREQRHRQQQQEGIFQYDSVMSDHHTVVKDLMVWVVWVLLYAVLLTQRRSMLDQYHTKTIVDKWITSRPWTEGMDYQKTFHTISSMDDWWAWAQGPLVQTIMADYNNYHYAADFGGGNSTGSGILRLIGGWRLRQVRVPEDCNVELTQEVRGQSVGGEAAKTISHAYGDYDRLICYSTTSYGPVAQYFSKAPNFGTLAREYDQNPFASYNITDEVEVAYHRGFMYTPSPSLYQTGRNRLDAPFYNYKNPNYFDTATITGLHMVYGGGGFTVELPKSLNASQAASILKKLQLNNWIDVQTRAVFALANFYNSNIGEFVVLEATAEFHRSGSVQTLVRVTPLVTDNFRTTQSKIYGIFDLIMSAAMFYLVWIQYRYWKAAEYQCQTDPQLVKRKRRCCIVTRIWLANLYTKLELLIIGPYLAARILDLVIYVDPKRDFTPDQTSYRDISTMASLYRQKFAIDSLGLLASCVKGFRFFSLHPKLQTISLTCSSIFGLLFAFILLFSMVFFAFLIIAFVLFGRELEQFSSFSRCSRTLLGLLLGNFDYDAMVKVKPQATPGFLFPYLLVLYCECFPFPAPAPCSRPRPPIQCARSLTCEFLIFSQSCSSTWRLQ